MIFLLLCANCGIKNHVRTVMNIDVEKNHRGMIKVNVEADGFLKYMVRNIVVHYLMWGKANYPDGVEGYSEAKDRRWAGITAPACGLFLKEVRY